MPLFTAASRPCQALCAKPSTPTTNTQVLLYAIQSDVQPSYDDALKLAAKDLIYPLVQSTYTTKLVRGDRSTLGNTALTDVSNLLQQYTVNLFATDKSQRLRPSKGTSRIAPAGASGKAGAEAGSGALDNGWKTKRLLRQSLAERDLVVKRAVHNFRIPELHTGLMGQFVDANGHQVLVIEVLLLSVHSMSHA